MKIYSERANLAFFENVFILFEIIDIPYQLNKKCSFLFLMRCLLKKFAVQTTIFGNPIFMRHLKILFYQKRLKRL